MKKLLVLAAVAAMAMGAKAEWTVPLSNVYIQLFNGNAHGDASADYKNFYLLETSDFNNWKQNSGKLEDLQSASWLAAIGADGYYGFGFVNEYEDLQYGTFTKGLTSDGSSLSLPWDPTKTSEHDITYVLASDTAYYMNDNVNGNLDAFWDPDPAEFQVRANVDVSSGGPTPFGGAAPVPEPTSGLLLLLGVAGLALKRRRV